jgi:hypothetical protein
LHATYQPSQPSMHHLLQWQHINHCSHRMDPHDACGGATVCLIVCQKLWVMSTFQIMLITPLFYLRWVKSWWHWVTHECQMHDYPLLCSGWACIWHKSVTQLCTFVYQDKPQGQYSGVMYE